MLYSELKERRAFTRFTIPIPVSYLSSISKEAGRAETNDISIEGLGLIAPEGSIPAKNLDICLEMTDNGEKIYAKCSLIWANMIEPGRYRVGLKIKEPKLKVIELVLRTIKARRKY